MSRTVAGWHLTVLMGCCAGAAILLVTWFWPTTRPIWDALDILAFNVFHGHLAHSGRAWHLFWAATNTRLFDGVSASVFGFIFFTYIWAGG